VVIILATVSCGVVIGLAIAETAVRLLHLAPGITKVEVNLKHGQFIESENRILKYIPKPGSPGINAYGIRDYDYPLEKPPHTFRIVVLGDSIGFGYCNDSESLALPDIFPKVLECLLQDSRADGRQAYEVINLSVSGYDTIQEVEFLVQKGLALHPDLVIVAYSLNDEWDSSLELLRLKDKRSELLLAPAGRYLFRVFMRSHLFRLGWMSIRSLNRKKWESLGRTRDMDRPLRGFQRLQSLARLHGFKVLVVIFPLFQDFDHYLYLDGHRRAAQRAEAAGFFVLDLLDDFRRESKGNFRALQGRCVREHPDEKGHAVAARSIYHFLISSGMVPESRAIPVR
jgi:hypothetical protein